MNDTDGTGCLNVTLVVLAIAILALLSIAPDIAMLARMNH